MEISLLLRPGPSLSRDRRALSVAQFAHEYPYRQCNAEAGKRGASQLHDRVWIPKGYIRLNAFRDDIKDAIQQVMSASGILTTSAFQNIGEISTTGVELDL